MMLKTGYRSSNRAPTTDRTMYGPYLSAAIENMDDFEGVVVAVEDEYERCSHILVPFESIPCQNGLQELKDHVT